ncbi:MAG: ABC transporter ATP-binding protein [Acetobacteraceae bacterium]|nr:ABC transporter ATP-binding protein [Acetobacteraceae bacterium]
MIAFEHITRAYGPARVVDDVTFTVEAGEFCALMGPSGSGKSTLLRMINRLIEPSGGTIRLDGEEVRHIPPQTLRRRIGYAIQSVGLFPHWTIARNIATVPRLLRWPRERIERRIDELLHLLDLDPAAMWERYPHQLSGGQQQRVGVARALAADPEMLLMDEPFGALDPVTRSSLQAELARIHRSTGKTIVFVTHDIEEALRLGTRIALLRKGKLVQFDTPGRLLAAPADDFVQSFVGSDIGLRLLSLYTAEDRLRARETAPGEPISKEINLRDALSLMIERGVDRLPVADRGGPIIGVLYAADLMQGRA